LLLGYGLNYPGAKLPVGKWIFLILQPVYPTHPSTQSAPLFFAEIKAERA
jgi:hypothetical protein